MDEWVLTSMRSFVCLEMRTFCVNFMTACNITSMNFSSFYRCVLRSSSFFVYVVIHGDGFVWWCVCGNIISFMHWSAMRKNAIKLRPGRFVRVQLTLWIPLFSAAPITWTTEVKKFQDLFLNKNQTLALSH